MCRKTLLTCLSDLLDHNSHWFLTPTHCFAVEASDDFPGVFGAFKDSPEAFDVRSLGYQCYLSSLTSLVNYIGTCCRNRVQCPCLRS